MVKKQDNLVLHLADYIPGVSEDVEKLESLFVAGRNVNCATTVENILAVPQKAQDFSSGTVGKDSPANAGDTGSIPGLGRFYMLQSN